MKYRLTKQDLLDTLAAWNSFLKRKVHLVACGGTALTLLDIKASTKDVDFMVPALTEYDYLTKTLKDLGYEQKAASKKDRFLETARYEVAEETVKHNLKIFLERLKGERLYEE